MKIELIASGDEIVTGKIADTNSARLAFDLTLRGYDVSRIIAVGDDIGRIADILVECSGRADSVICAGGLGPTSDDLTTEAAAKAAGVELEFREEAWRDIERRFAKINLPIAPTNRKQAILPKGAEILQNPIGTAPGYLIKIRGVPCFFAPGVPRELFMMFDEQILPRLEKIRPDSLVYLTKVWRTFGYAESGLGGLLEGVTEKYESLRLSFRATFPEIQVGLSARAKTRDEAEKSLNPAAEVVESRIGQWVYSRDGRTLPEVVGDLLKEKGLKLAVAESCTGGMIGQMITSVPGSSDYFMGSIVSYSNELKTGILKAPKDIIRRFGAVSEECAKAMAEGVRNLAEAGIGLSVTGIAGPTGGTPEKPVGTVFLACATASGTEVRGGLWPRGDREQIRLISSYAALDLVRKMLSS